MWIQPLYYHNRIKFFSVHQFIVFFMSTIWDCGGKTVRLSGHPANKEVCEVWTVLGNTVEKGKLYKRLNRMTEKDDGEWRRRSICRFVTNQISQSFLSASQFFQNSITSYSMHLDHSTFCIDTIWKFKNYTFFRDFPQFFKLLLSINCFRCSIFTSTISE